MPSLIDRTMEFFATIHADGTNTGAFILCSKILMPLTAPISTPARVEFSLWLQNVSFIMQTRSDDNPRVAFEPEEISALGVPVVAVWKNLPTLCRDCMLEAVKEFETIAAYLRSYPDHKMPVAFVFDAEGDEHLHEILNNITYEIIRKVPEYGVERRGDRFIVYYGTTIVAPGADAGNVSD